ncbi:MAG: glycosyltransferase family 8 protein [Devosia sp.]
MTRAAPIIVATSLDRDYLPLALVVATSIARANRSGRPVEFHILYAGPDDWPIARLERFNRRNVSVVLHRVVDRFAHLGTVGRYPSATYVRAQIPDVLAAHDRAIYLDVDLVVLDELGDLFDFDLGGAPLGATQCVLTITAALMNGTIRSGGRIRPTSEYFVEELGLTTRAAALGYTQAGVQLFDLAQLRRLDYAGQMLALTSAMQDRLAFCDQCAANRLFQGQIALIHPRWNVAPFALNASHDTRVPVELQPVMRQQREKPGIIHFGGRKPWQYAGIRGSWYWWRAAAGSGALLFLLRRDGRALGTSAWTMVRQRLPRIVVVTPIVQLRDRLVFATSVALQRMQRVFPRPYAKIRGVFRAVWPKRSGKDGTSP